MDVTGLGAEVIIRDAHRADFGQWRLLFEEYNAFYGRSGPTALTEDVIQTTWVRLLDDGEPMCALVAEAGERLVGLAHFISHRNTITVEDTCYLQDLFANPSMRGQGIGRQLIEAFYGRARDAGTKGVYWHTHVSNATAMGLYDQVADNTGFVVYRQTLPPEAD